MKKRGIALLLSIILLLGTSGLTLAAAQSSTNMTINAIIMSPISITMFSGLDFGRLFKGGAALTVDPANPPAGTAPAEFTVTGEQNTGFTVTLPANASISDGTTTIGVSSFTSTLIGGVGTLSATGDASFRVGATIDAIPEIATSGTYTGNATITVAYNF